MGTYHSIPNDSQSLRRGKPRGKVKTRKQVHDALDYALANPTEVLSDIGPMFDMGRSTMANLLYAGARSRPNKHAISWLKKQDPRILDGSGRNNLARWEQERPQNSVHTRLREALHSNERNILEAQPNVVGVGFALADALPKVLASARGQEIVAEVGGKFTPQTPDDLLVLIEQATTIKAQAETAAQEAAELIAAVGMVRDWVNNQARLDAALKEVEHLKAQLVAADKIKSDYQRRAMATNQVHSID
jgi:hypothetical protein